MATPVHDARAAQATGGGAGKAAPAKQAGRGGDLRQAAKAKGYEEGRQMLSPQKASGRASGLSSLSSFVDGLAAKARAGAATLEAEAGQFVEAEVALDIDVPTVPGLSVSVQGEVWYERYGSGEQFLHLRSITGVKYGLGRIFNVGAGMVQRLELTGESLGAALIDAVKQCAYLMLERAGVHQQFRELERLAREGPGFWDYAKALIPVYGNYEVAKLAIARFGADNIRKAYQGFVEFFRNDESVSFDASIGVMGAGGAKAGGVEGGLMLAASVGVEDVEGREAKAFGEVAGEGRVERGNSYALLRVAKRWYGAGQTSLSIDFWGAFAYSKGIDPKGRGVAILARVLGGQAFRMTMAQLGQAKQGGGRLTAVSQVASTFIDLAAAGGAKGEIAESMAGIELSLEQRNGRWEGVTARVKSMVGSGFDAGKAEVGLKVGGFWEVSGEVEKLLQAAEGAGGDAGRKGHGGAAPQRGRAVK
jgi:hypothetical protein